jgi:hypothetical protein
LPGGEGWQFEPKWDGFLVVVAHDHVSALDLGWRSNVDLVRCRSGW